MLMERVPDDWARRTPLHQEALASCRANEISKPDDCLCCGCHTNAVDLAIPVEDLISEARCPAERRALQRIAASRRVTG